MHRVLAILAAGNATRAGVDKVLADLGGQPVLAWSLASGLAAGCFDEVIVVAQRDNLARITRTVQERAPTARVISMAARTSMAHNSCSLRSNDHFVASPVNVSAPAL